MGSSVFILRFKSSLFVCPCVALQLPMFIACQYSNLLEPQVVLNIADQSQDNSLRSLALRNHEVPP